MKKYIFLLAVLTSCFNAIAQTPTFNGNYIFRQPLDNESLSLEIEVDNGYLLAGTSYTWNNVYSSFDSRLVILKTDYFGNVTRKIIYGDSGYAFSTTHRRGILKNSDGNIVLLLNLISGYYDNRIILMELTPDGDSVLTREIIRPVGYEGFLFPSALAQTADKGYAIAGYYGYTGAIIKTDSTGIVEWIKLVGENSIHSVVDGISLVSLPDTGVLAGYYVYDSQGGGAGHSGVVCKFDKQGGYRWSRSIGPQDDYFFQDQVLLATTENSSIMVFTNYFIPNSSTDKRFEILKLNPDGSVIWDRNIGTDHNYITLNDVARLKDSTWLIAGSLYSGKSFILNVNSDADSLFYREFTLSSSDRPSREQRLIHHSFYTVTGTLDDGLLMAGSTSGNNSSDHDPWVVKTDRYGCMQPGCEPLAIYVTVQPQPASVCPKDTASFTMKATGDSLSFQWQILEGNRWQSISDDSVYSGSKTDSLYIRTTEQMTGDHSLRCRVNNMKYTMFGHEALLSVKDPVSITRNPHSLQVKLHSSAVFSVTATGTRPFSYQWYWKDKLISDAADSIFIIEDVVEEDAPGPYHCRVSNACRQVNSDYAFIIINTEGIGDRELTERIEIFPNPAEENLTIRCTSQPEFPLIIRILDLTGQVIKSITSGNQETVINVQTIPAGCYFLKLEEGSKKIYRKIFLY